MRGSPGKVERAGSKGEQGEQGGARVEQEGSEVSELCLK